MISVSFRESSKPLSGRVVSFEFARNYSLMLSGIISSYVKRIVSSPSLVIANLTACGVFLFKRNALVVLIYDLYIRS